MKQLTSEERNDIHSRVDKLRSKWKKPENRAIYEAHGRAMMEECGLSAEEAEINLRQLIDAAIDEEFSKDNEEINSDEHPNK